MKLVNCVRSHGFNLPDPNDQGRVSLRGINTKDPNYKTAVLYCFHHQ